MKLADEQLEALFCLHWERTHDLTACLRLIADAATIGQTRAFVRAGAAVRRGARPVVVSKAFDRMSAVAAATTVLDLFADRFDVDVRDLVGRGATRKISDRRWEAMWVLRKVTDMSFPEIGLAVGGRHHTVAIRGVHLVEQRMAADEVLRARLEAFVADLTGRRAA